MTSLLECCPVARKLSSARFSLDAGGTGVCEASGAAFDDTSASLADSRVDVGDGGAVLSLCSTENGYYTSTTCIVSSGTPKLERYVHDSRSEAVLIHSKFRREEGILQDSNPTGQLSYQIGYKIRVR